MPPVAGLTINFQGDSSSADKAMSRASRLVRRQSLDSAGDGAKSVKNLYHPVEQAILFDYFGIPRLRALEGPDVKGECPTRRGPVRVVEPADLHSSELALANAVARIALSRAQGRLPQWAAVTASGEVHLGRRRWHRDGQQVSLMPQHLFTINWGDSGPGFSWPEAYHCTALPGFDRSVVTASVDSPDTHGYTDFGIGWIPASEAWLVGCKRIITGWWRCMHGDDFGYWEYLFNSGAISEDEAYEWREEVWFEEGEQCR